MERDENTGPRPGRPAARIATLALLAVLGAVSGCGMPELPGLYRIDVQQGNVVDRKMASRLEIGMEESKVRFILGTPLLVDPFNPNRWDYIYTLRQSSGSAVRRHLALYFTDGRLARVEGDLESGTAPDSERAPTLVTVPQRETREGFLERLVPDFLKDDGEPESGAGAPEEPSGTGVPEESSGTGSDG